MELSVSWEAANCAATQEFNSILWNPMAYYRAHNILSQIDPVNTIPSYASMILNIN
jgi:hypothetical protein